MVTSTKEQVLILGGGFGGVKAALELCKDDDFNVTLVTDNDSLRYYPTLYQTATGSKRSNSAIPLNNIFADKKVVIHIDTAVSIDRKKKQVQGSSGQFYDYQNLIISLGVVTNYFGIPGLAEYSYSIKSQPEIDKFKRHLHQQLEDDKHPDLNYVIIGAGPTGIELAGALPSYINYLMENHRIKTKKIHIDLIEAAPRLLPRMPRDTSKAVKKHLQKIGIKLYLGSTVSAETIDEILVNGKPIRSHTVIWTAGVTNHPFFKDNNFVLTTHNKVSVNTYLQAEDNIYVIGDNANTPYSGTAQTALRDGRFVAKNLKRLKHNKQPNSYVAKPNITVIPAGPKWAAVVIDNLRIYGWLGWLLRELADLIGFHDLEPWNKARTQWKSEFIKEEDCKICDLSNYRH